MMITSLHVANQHLVHWSLHKAGRPMVCRIGMCLFNRMSFYDILFHMFSQFLNFFTLFPLLKLSHPHYHSCLSFLYFISLNYFLIFFPHVVSLFCPNFSKNSFYSLTLSLSFPLYLCVFAAVMKLSMWLWPSPVIIQMFWSCRARTAV